MMKKRYLVALLLLSLLGYGCSDNNSVTSSDEESPSEESTCTDAEGTEYDCENVELLARVGVEEFQGDSLRLNDIWGWTDPSTGKEYALVGLSDGVSFVDISSPGEPVVLGKLEESIDSTPIKVTIPQTPMHRFHDDHEAKSAWRDFKVHEDYLFVVSDGQPHGLQVFDLARLRDVKNPPVNFTEDSLYNEFGNAHNLAINEETGYAYAVGSNTYGGGLHIIDIRDPLSPQLSGSHSDSTVGNASTGYVHDTQCVVYRGPDVDHEEEEICFNSSETHLAIANVTDKDSTFTLAAENYENAEYAHQGWLTEDHQYFLLDDELDEERGNLNTRTIIWDVRDLDNPEVIGTYESTTPSIDHNQYIKGSRSYQANYTSGLRILDITNIASGDLEEIAYFDTFPQSDAVEFDGAWSNYPYFESGIVIVSDVTNGLFILRPNL